MEPQTSPAQTPVDSDLQPAASDDGELELYSLDEIFGDDPPWYAEEGWCNPAVLSTSVEEDVPLVDVQFAPGSQHKSAVTIDLAADLSLIDAFHLDVLSMPSEPIRIAMLFRTAAGDAFETPLVAIEPGWSRVCFSLVDADLKSNTSSPPWASYSVAFEPRDAVTQISLLIYGGQQSGVVRFGPLLAQLAEGVALEDAEG